MNNLLEIREKIQEFYANHTRIIEKTLRFILNVAVFFMIQSKLGYMSALSKGIISLGIAVICTFLPRVCTAIIGAVMVLLQMYALSPGILIIVFCVFALIFIFYLRFASNQSIVLLLVVLAFAFKMPILIPVIAGLAGGMTTLIPLACGTVVFYMLQSAVTYGASLTSDDSIATVLTGFAKSSLQNKEMMIAVVAVLLGMIVVRAIKGINVAYSWQIAIVVGSVVSAIVFVVGGAGIASGSVIASMIVAIVAGLVLQFMIFNVDYSRSEQVQFEDDEYYYYVKAIPKNVAGRKKQTKKKR